MGNPLLLLLEEKVLHIEKQTSSEKQNFGRSNLLFNPVKSTEDYYFCWNKHLLRTRFMWGSLPTKGTHNVDFPFMILCLEYTPKLVLSKIILNVVILTCLNKNSKCFIFPNRDLIWSCLILPWSETSPYSVTEYRENLLHIIMCLN